MAKPFQHLVEFIKPICIGLGRTCMRKSLRHVYVCISVKLCTILLKAPQGWYDPYWEPSTQTPLKKTHTHAHKFKSAHTNPPCSTEETPSGRAQQDCINVPDFFSGISKKKLVFVFYVLTPNVTPRLVPFVLCSPEGLAERMWACFC